MRPVFQSVGCRRSTRARSRVVPFELGIVWGSLGENVTEVGEERSSFGDDATFVGRTSGFREQALTLQFERRTLGTVRVAESPPQPPGGRRKASPREQDRREAARRIRGGSEGKPQGGPKDGQCPRGWLIGAEERCPTGGSAKVGGFPGACRLAPGGGCPTRLLLRVAADHHGRSPEEHGRFRPDGYSGLRRVRARFYPVEPRTTMGPGRPSTAQGSSTSVHRSHSSSRVVWARANGTATADRTRSPSA